MIISSQTVDLLISYSQITVISCDLDEELFQWGDINVAQGAVIYPDCVTFDPLADGTFGANVILSLADNFVLDQHTSRAILVPFVVTDEEKLSVESAGFSNFKIELNLTKSKYHLYFEICKDAEVFYKFTFIASDEPISPIYLLDDNWGGVKNKKLELGYK